MNYSILFEIVPKYSFIHLFTGAFKKTDILFEFGVKEPNVGPTIMTKQVNSLQNYELIGSETGNCSSMFLQSRYTCIEVLFTFKRLSYKAVTRIYVPTSFLLILSWIPFFLLRSKSITSISSSLTVSISSLLSLVFLTTYITTNGPSMDTINAGDIWTGTCLLFSFLAFIHVSIIEMLEKKNVEKEGEKEGEGGAVKKPLVIGRENGIGNIREYIKSNRVRFAVILGKFLHPILFILFNIIYWTCLS